MAPATLFPSTIRDYAHKKYLSIQRINNRNLLIIPDETKIQEAYKRGDTTSDNNAFCAFKKQLCEYGFSVVARKDWLSLGLDLDFTWVYEHRNFTPENCEKCILRKPSKPITVRFQINTETGEIEWVNSAKTVMHGEKLINCIKETMSSNVLMSPEHVREEEDRSVLGRKRSLGKTSSDEDHSDVGFLSGKKSSKKREVGARKSMDSCVSDDFKLTHSFANSGYVAPRIENNGIFKTNFQSNSDLLNCQAQINFSNSILQNSNLPIPNPQDSNLQNSNLPGTALQNTNLPNSVSNTLVFDRNMSDSRQLESPNSYIQVDSPNSFQMQSTDLKNAALQIDALQNTALQNIALQNTFLRNSILLNLSRQSSPLQNSNLQTSPLPIEPTSNSLSTALQNSIAPCSTVPNSASSSILTPNSIIATSSIPTPSVQSNYHHFLIPHGEQPNQILQLIPMIVTSSSLDAPQIKWTTDEIPKK